MTSTPRFSPRHLVRMRRLGAFDVSPDGRWLVVAVDELSEDEKTYVTNLYRLDVERPEGGLVALTRSTRKKTLPRFAPDGRLAFLSEPDAAAHRPPPPAEAADGVPPRKNDEKPVLQVHRMALDGGEPEKLTDLPGGVSSFRFSADGRRLVLLAPVDPEARDLAHDRELHAKWKDRKTTGRLFRDFPLRHWDSFHGPRFPHLIVADADGTNPRDLTPGLGFGLGEADFDVSPDGRRACVDFRTTGEDLRTRCHLVLVDLETGERRALTTGETTHVQPRYAPDGARVACIAQDDRMRVTGKRDLKVVTVASGEASLAAQDVDLWPAELAWLDERRIAWSADENGSTLARVTTLGGGTASLTDAGHASGLVARGGRLFFLRDRFHEPSDVHVVTPGGAVARLTSANEALVSGLGLTPGRSHVVPGADGVPVQLWEVLPPDFDPSRRYPLLVWIHGGPLGAFTDWFHYRWNPHLAASAGHVVVLVNPRGSTGFGQAFIEGNNGDWGNRCFRDIMAVADAWAERPYVDPSRMAAMGASFGGYMVNWIAGHEHRFKCLVSHAGLFDLPAFWGTTDSGPDWELEFGGTPFESPDLYERWSPSGRATSFRTPTLVIHGELDYRVPLGEGLAMYQALRRRGVPAKFLYFPDENHWILKPANMVYWNEVVLEWLAEHLGA